MLAVLATVLHKRVQHRALAQSVTLVRTLARADVGPLLPAGRRQRPLPADSAAALDRWAKASRDPVKLYSDDGTVVYATDRTVVGRSQARDSDISAALAGRTVADIEEKSGELGSPDHMLEVYLPIDRGVFEGYLPLRPRRARDHPRLAHDHPRARPRPPDATDWPSTAWPTAPRASCATRPARSAHRLPNRVALHDRAAPGGSRREGTLAACCSSTSIASRRSTTRSATEPATTASRSPSACAGVLRLGHVCPTGRRRVRGPPPNRDARLARSPRACTPP